MQDFSERLDYLLAGRRIYPWARGLGVSNGAAESMKKGNIPGPDILGIIRQKENVNLDWLITGNGCPFIIEWCERAEKLQKILEFSKADQGADEPFWLHFVTDGQRLTLIIRKPSLYQYKESEFVYYDHRLLSVKVYPDLLRTIRNFCSSTELISCLHQLPHEQMNHLQNGLLGPFLVLGNEQAPSPLTENQDLPSPDSLLEKLEASQPAPEPLLEVSTDLMRSVIQCVESTALEEGIELDSIERARVYTASYRHAVRSGLKSREINASHVLISLDML